MDGAYAAALIRATLASERQCGASRDAGAQAAASYVFDLLGDIPPIHLIVDAFTGGHSPQQRRLPLGPEQHVVVVEITHAAGSRVGES
jgi:hypothetical protein